MGGNPLVDPRGSFGGARGRGMGAARGAVACINQIVLVSLA